ncbi:sulfate reduction electron transfer complex DsrMKJOP subunit DsrO [Tropicimonas sp. IMCC6043]|uniref:sulfate reduction electron transfer complex DsrMKJOP subunit DsrO n=1 Tax=Tropicimonas sp. IMCC6043 TaxID=2510645 RepID=UPI00101D10C1|nr:4Fe-4S dicluster domain-containing protein [Tropicimonas sp. IMCC6043]RYH06796.1 4Fe-4S dicluster domain-containing protein [Tropicimonas sp. IMCC6043]
MNMNRRGFLGAVGRVSIGAAASVAGGAGAANAAKADHIPKWGMVVDLRKCIGCQACTVACIMENDVPEDAFRTHVSVYELVKDGQDPAMVMLPRLCNHCENPPCVPVCPVEATFKAESGEVLVDASRCVGCAYCVQACPYDARFINHETQTADKCTFCFHRTQAGLLPACVETCVGGARNFGDLNDPESAVSKLLAENEVSVLRPEMQTNPNVYYIGLEDVLSGRVAGEAAYRPAHTAESVAHAEGV